MSLYIIEGARNSGKTTVVNKLVRAYPPGRVSAIKFSRTTNPPVFMTEFLSSHYLALIDSRSICVLDRFHLTEFVMRSLDKKVPISVLNVTTHMIDQMLKDCGAITYIVNASVDVRMERGRHRDIAHNKKEWSSYEELDAAWSMAKKIFNKCKTKVMPGDTETQINAIVADIMVEQKTMTRLESKIAPFAPIIEIEAQHEYANT